MNPLYVPLDAIDPNPFNTRQDYGDIPALAADIDRNGLLQIPLGRLVMSDGDYRVAASVLELREDVIFGASGLRVQLAFGHRRLAAMRHLDAMTSLRRKMPVHILRLTDADMLDLSWSENAARADPNPIEQAELLYAKWQQLGTQQAVADAWGLPRSTITNKIRLLNLSDEAKTAVRAGRLSERQAMALLSGDDDDVTLETLTAIRDGDTPPASDEIRSRKRYAPRSRPAAVNIDAVPMLIHGKAAMWPDDDILRRVALGARTACRRCIAAVGPPNELVCRECPGVTLIISLSRSFAPGTEETTTAPEYLPVVAGESYP